MYYKKLNLFVQNPILVPSFQSKWMEGYANGVKKMSRSEGVASWLCAPLNKVTEHVKRFTS